jgi:hypothetical protein
MWDELRREQPCRLMRGRERWRRRAGRGGFSLESLEPRSLLNSVCPCPIRSSELAFGALFNVVPPIFRRILPPRRIPPSAPIPIPKPPGTPEQPGKPTPELRGFVLVDADRDKDLFQLSDGQQFDLSRLPQFNIRFAADPGVTTVQFGLNQTANYRTDNTNPFSLGTGNGSNFAPWTPTLGPQKITATPFTQQPGGALVAGQPVTIKINLFDTRPSSLSVNPSAYNRVNLRWKDNSTTETGQLVQRRTTGGTFATIATLPADTTEFADLTVTGGVFYEYRVAAQMPEGELFYSDANNTFISTTAPDAPTDFAVTPYAYNRIDLTWNDPAENEQGFRIERSTNGGATFLPLTSVEADNEAFSDTTVDPNVNYAYRIVAYNPGGNSDFSPIGSATTFNVPPYPLRPGADNTGPTNPDLLTPHVGSIVVTQDGAVIENLHVTGSIRVMANNVTIRNVIVDADDDFYGIQCSDNFTGTLIEDAEIFNASSAGIYGRNYAARRLHVHHIGSDGLKSDGNSVVEDSWLHDLGMTPGAHADGIQIGIGTDFFIRGNFFDMPAETPGRESNAAVFVKADFGPIDNVLVENNWMNGGNFTVYVLKEAFSTINATIRHNYLGPDYLYGVSMLDPNVVWVDNVWADTGAPVPASTLP